MLVVDLLKPIRPLGRKGLHNAQLNRQRLEDSAHSAIHAVAYNHIVQVVVRLEKIGFIENLVVFYLENSGHKITLYTKRWFALANHFFLCYNIFRYFSIFGGFLLTLNQYLL